MSRPPSPSSSIEDPEIRWSLIRSAWLTPSTSRLPLQEDQDSKRNSSSTSSDEPPSTTVKAGMEEGREGNGSGTRRNPKDVVFQQRIKTLEQMLRVANSGGPVPSRAATSMCQGGGGGQVPILIDTPSIGGKGKEKEVVEAMEEPDDGFAVGGEKKGSTQELKKISEGIFLAFKQGRALKESLPLSLVTSLLFRSWILDGTIPRDYCRSLAEPDPPMPVPLSSTNSTTTIPFENTVLNVDGPAPIPSPLAVLSEMNPTAVTPLPSGAEEEEDTNQDGGGGSSHSRREFDETGNTDTTRGELSTPLRAPPSDTSATTIPSLLPHLLKKPGLNPLQSPTTNSSSTRDVSSGGGGGGSSAGGGGSSSTTTASLEGMGPDETSGKLKLDVLRGSRWRTERDVASGSDII